ncbi:MAG: type II secretion system F family protein [Candidatus Riflebacteria bacterium]|nr:type II secretion system F family protein [Candidatus Riflebacteria bacterium]
MIFRYTGRNSTGSEETGTIDSPDEKQALASLSNKGIFVTSVKPEKPDWNLQAEVSFLNWVPSSVLNAFLIQLSVLLKCGVPLVESIASLEEGESNKYFKNILQNIRKAIEEGRSFSDALSTHPNVFSPFFVNMVRLGESGGVLEKVLNKLSQINQRSQAIRSQIISALAYPALLITVTMAVLAILFGFAIPRFAEVFKSANFPLPLPTKIILTIGIFFKLHLKIIFVIFILSALALLLFALTRAGRWIAGEIILRTPVFSTIVRTYLIVHISESLGLLLSAGVPLLELLSSVETTVDMPTPKKVIRNMSDFVERGSTLKLSLEGNIIFPPMAVKLIETGEKTGMLEKMFEEIALFYEASLQNALKVVMSLIEPLLILFMAFIVGFIMLSVILPIFQMSSLVKGRM